MRSLLEILNLSTTFLKDKNIPNALREAQDLFCDALNLNRMQLYLEHDRPLSDKELVLLRERVQRRAKGEPGAYIHGQVKFLEATLHVTPSVLIPRQETEILTHNVIEYLKNENTEGKIFWDLCCGSGCIGISVKKAVAPLQVIASDISPVSLEIARKNCTENQVDVLLLQGDLLAPYQGLKADFVVCNPPYIAENEWLGLENEVRLYEPKNALISGPTGLEIYQRLAEELPAYLNSGAKVWFEIGASQGESILSLFTCAPWKKLHIEKDYAGKDRFFSLEIE